MITKPVTRFLANGDDIVTQLPLVEQHAVDLGMQRTDGLVERVAQEHQIPYQVTVRDSGGTDAGNIHKENLGIPSIVLGTPARYIHSHNAMINLNDYLAMVKLSTALVKALDQETVDGLTQYL